MIGLWCCHFQCATGSASARRCETSATRLVSAVSSPSAWADVNGRAKSIAAAQRALVRMNKDMEWEEAGREKRSIAGYAVPAFGSDAVVSSDRREARTQSSVPIKRIKLIRQASRAQRRAQN
ncbi:hypothetical protein PUN4_490017 [Paraburkholderia unamae]|nr:hypothetical protein PUN4_490017 [Paraburkholderia unamae]